MITVAGYVAMVHFIGAGFAVSGKATFV